MNSDIQHLNAFIGLSHLLFVQEQGEGSSQELFCEAAGTEGSSKELFCEAAGAKGRTCVERSGLFHIPDVC